MRGRGALSVPGSVPCSLSQMSVASGRGGREREGGGRRGSAQAWGGRRGYGESRRHASGAGAGFAAGDADCAPPPTARTQDIHQEVEVAR